MRASIRTARSPGASRKSSRATSSSPSISRPPIFGRRNPDTDLPEKYTFGGWLLKAMKVLAKGKRLRGTPFDFFGRTAERKAERALITDYEARIEKLLTAITPANLTLGGDICGRARYDPRLRPCEGGEHEEGGSALRRA